MITNELKENFRDDFHSEATKQSKRSSHNLDKQIEEIKSDSIYKTPSSLDSNKFKYTKEALYCDLSINYNNENIYLRINRTDSEFNYSFGYFNEDISEDDFKFISPAYANKKPITKQDKERNRILGSYAKGKFEIKESLSEIAIDLINTKNYEVITNDFKVFEKMAEEIANEDDIEEEDDNPKYYNFSDYPKDIQEEAKKLIQEDKFFDNIKESVNISHAEDDNLIHNLILIGVSVYIGSPIHCFIGGETGKGKTDLCKQVFKNFPKHHIYELEEFSPRYIYYAKDKFNEDFNILLIDDIDLSKKSIIELLKRLTDNSKKTKKLETVIDGKAVKFELTGKFLVILTNAKGNDDKELSNRLFNLNILNDVNKESKVKYKIKDNDLSDIENNIYLQRLNLINQACITYFIEKDIEVYNPYSFFVNPSFLDNRNISDFFNLINSTSFFNYNNRCKQEIKEHNIILGTIKDISDVLDSWDIQLQKDKLNHKQQEILKLPIPTYTLQEAMDHQEEIQNQYLKADSKTFREEIHAKEWSRKKISEATGINKNTLKFELDVAKEDRNTATLEELGLIKSYYFNENNTQLGKIYYKPKETENSKNSISKNNYWYDGIFGMYQSIKPLEVKRSIIINILNRYNLCINKEEEKIITSFCKEYKDIDSEEDMAGFINEFFRIYGDNFSYNFEASVENIKEHFKIIEKNNLYFYEEDLYQSKKTAETSLNDKRDSNSMVHNENTSKTNIKKDKEEQSEKIVIDVDRDLSERIQKLLEYYKKGLTKAKIFEELEITEEDSHETLKLEATLERLVKEKILRIESDTFKQYYVLREEV